MEKPTSSTTSDDLTFCFDTLVHVSRSFAIVINNLEEPLRTTVCVFYLILRALDTIEDDTTMDESIKLEALKVFPTYLDRSVAVCPDGLRFQCDHSNSHYGELIDNFDKVLRVYGQSCTSAEKKIIRDVVDEMADGMIKYANASIETMAEYNEYCYYVAGLVGVGVTRLVQLNFVLDNVRDNDLQRLAISTGMFLQKTNILRDIYEDMGQPAERCFYPKEVWRKYVTNSHDLIDEKFLPSAIGCLNVLINDAFQHLPDTIAYLSLVSRMTIFKFFAIPQIIAVGTLEKMFNNPAVFRSNVKLSSAESGSILETVEDMTSCLKVMRSYLLKLSARIDSLNQFEETKNWILESLKFVDSYAVMRWYSDELSRV